MDGKYFARLSEAHRIAVMDHARLQYDKLVFQAHETEEMLKAQADPEGWVEHMCDLIAADPLRLLAILQK